MILDTACSTTVKAVDEKLTVSKQSFTKQESKCILGEVGNENDATVVKTFVKKKKIEKSYEEKNRRVKLEEKISNFNIGESPLLHFYLIGFKLLFY